MGPSGRLRGGGVSALGAASGAALSGRCRVTDQAGKSWPKGDVAGRLRSPGMTKAALPAGERPVRRSGAEGTRTPDPHTARAAERGPKGFNAVHIRRSD